jgi:hypothetical protein
VTDLLKISQELIRCGCDPMEPRSSFSVQWHQEPTLVRVCFGLFKHHVVAEPAAILRRLRACRSAIDAFGALMEAGVERENGGAR